jgi:RNA polymerase sigma factor (sigma-70 family)
MAYLTHSCPEGVALRARLLELWERTGRASLGSLAQNGSPREGHVVANEQEYSDWVSTCLMETFKDTGDPSVFALLFELNRASFLHAIQGSLRRVYHHVDALDVLQEVFLNIYRYPHRFQADRADAFRGWGHRIARNTLLKFLKGQSRLARFHEIDDETIEPEDVRGRRPDLVASDAESASVVNNAYLIYLQLYLLHYGRLSEKEQRALRMVEVDGVSYRDAAAVLGIRLENLKMVIFRGRRKIFRGMEQSVAHFAMPVDEPRDDAKPIATRGVTPRQFAGDTRAGRRIFERSTRSRAATRDPEPPGA